MRVAITGSAGRLGRALTEALGDAPFTGPFGPLAWTRREFDLDSPGTIGDRLEKDRIECVVHAAAWTDVDGCARDPDLARRRNGEATTILAQACASRGIDLVAISTNEVFDGHRTDERGYTAADATNPINAYGASKLAGELGARRAYERLAGVKIGAYAGEGSFVPGSVQLAIVRTAWLFGPPGNDFPSKILAAAERARAAGTPLKVVGDEVGSPTFTVDLAAGIVELLWSGAFSGLHHVVNAGAVSRADWAREVFRQAGVAVEIEEVPASTWPRASTPPAWAVLDPTPLPGGEPLESWQAALAHDLPSLLRTVARP